MINGSKLIIEIMKFASYLQLVAKRSVVLILKRLKIRSEYVGMSNNISFEINEHWKTKDFIAIIDNNELIGP